MVISVEYARTEKVEDDLTSAPQEVQMLKCSCAGAFLTLVSHVSQVVQVRFYPLNRSLIDAEGLFRQKEALVHAFERGLLACGGGLPAAQCVQGLSSVSNCSAHLMKPRGLPTTFFQLTFETRPDNAVLVSLFECAFG